LQITVENLSNVAYGLKAELGDQFCERLIAGYDSNRIGSMAAHALHQAAAHPFALAWDDLMRGAADSAREGVFKLSEEAFFLLNTLHFFSIAKRDPHFNGLVGKMAGKDQFFSTVFEALTYASYVERGTPISLVPESGKSGRRTPDLVSFIGEQSVFVECKNLQDDLRNEDKVLSRLGPRIGSVLDRQRGSYLIQISSRKKWLHSDVEPIVSTVADMIRNFPLLLGAEIRDCDVRIGQLLSAGQTLRLPFDLPYSVDKCGWMGMKGHGEIDHAYVSKLWVVEAERFFDFRQGRRLVDLFRDAADQLPTGSPGVVHLQIPNRDPERFLQIFDDARPQLEKILMRRNHVCAIVLTGRFLNKKMTEHSNTIQFFHCVIPNFLSNYRLPRGFCLPCSIDRNDFFVKNGNTVSGEISKNSFHIYPEGKLNLSFEINEAVEAQKGRYLYRHCSFDGREQLSIWQSYNGKCRIEVIEEKFGRRTSEFDLNYLAIYMLHSMWVSWTRDEVFCVVDGVHKNGSHLTASARGD
jgi:hypothetical protein